LITQLDYELIEIGLWKFIKRLVACYRFCLEKYLFIGQMGAVVLLKVFFICLEFLLLGIYCGNPVKFGTGGEGIADDRRIYGYEFRQPRLRFKIEGIGRPEKMTRM